MKALFTISIFFLINFQYLYAQVGLLSTNNKQVISNVTDTLAFKLPDITNDATRNNRRIYSSPFVNYSYPSTPDNSRILLDSITVYSSDFNRNLVSIQQKSKKIVSNNKNTKINKQLKIQIDSLNKVNENLTFLIKNKTDELNSTSRLKQKNDSVLNVLIQKNLALTKKIFIDKLDTLDNKANGFEDALNRSNFLTRHYAIDTSKKIIDNEKFTLAMSDIYSGITKLSKRNDKIQVRLDQLQIDIENIELPDSINDASAVVNKLERDLKKITLDTAAISTEFQADTLKYKNLQETYEKILKDYVSDKKGKEESKQTDFGAFPQLTTILGKKEVIPQLQLYGSYLTESKSQSFEANLGISFAPSNNPDTANLYTIFIPTASKFLVHSNFTWSFLPVGTSNNDSAKKVGFRLDISFASKNLLYDTIKSNKTITSSLLYAKAGIELGIIPKRLSLYSNINTATVLDKVDEFQSGTGVHTKFLGYLDCGARLYFDPTPAAKVADGLFIYSNLNFIINSGDVKRVTKSNDTVIPSIQVGMVKTLGKF